MSKHPHRLLPLLLVLPLLQCDPPPPPPPASYTYYTTCGDPVCGGHRDNGVPACTTEKEGDKCATLDKRCDPGNGCNSLVTCASKDPKQQPGGCPISRRRYKTDVAYVSQPELVRYHEQMRRVRLATYAYRDAPKDQGGARRRLGFLIEVQEQSMSVDPERDMVDLYGYTSMAVAALQVQGQKIEALEKELGRLRAQLGKGATAGSSPAGSRRGARPSAP